MGIDFTVPCRSFMGHLGRSASPVRPLRYSQAISNVHPQRTRLNFVGDANHSVAVVLRELRWHRSPFEVFARFPHCFDHGLAVKHHRDLSGHLGAHNAASRIEPLIEQLLCLHSTACRIAMIAMSARYLTTDLPFTRYGAPM